MLTRRRFFHAALAASASALGAGLYAWQIEPHWLELVIRSLPMRGLPPELVGLRLAQLSDVHVGPRVRDAYVLDTFARITSLAPDIVVYTGDFTSYHDAIFAQAERLYASAPRGRLATLGILGNHDYGIGWSHPEVAARLVDIFQVSPHPSCPSATPATRPANSCSPVTVGCTSAVAWVISSSCGSTSAPRSPCLP